MPEIIGRGEILAKRILDFIHPGCYVLTQIPMRYFMEKFAPQDIDYISEENLKRTVDLYVMSGEYNKQAINMVVRIQDQRSHKGDLKGKIDDIQKKTLQDMGVMVVDIHERECKDLFKNKLSWRSTWEIVREIEKVHRDSK